MAKRPRRDPTPPPFTEIPDRSALVETLAREHDLPDESKPALIEELKSIDRFRHLDWEMNQGRREWTDNLDELADALDAARRLLTERRQINLMKLNVARLNASLLRDGPTTRAAE